MHTIEPQNFPMFERAVEQYHTRGFLSQDVFGSLSAEDRLAAFEEASRRDA